MKEVIVFLNEELRQAEKKVGQLKDRIRSMAFDIDSTDKACKKMIHNQDCTGMVFLSRDDFTGFEGEELKRLQKQKKELIELKKQYEQKLQTAEDRYQRLKQLVSKCADKDENIQDRYSGLTLQEEDRQRIAMDIHDTVIQNLTALIMKNQFVIKIMTADPQRAALELKSMNEVLKNSISELRDIIFNLRPMSLDDLGFEDTFYNLMNKISRKTDMDVQFDYHAGSFEADSIVMINILRIIQELCTNSIKHSNGKHILVRIMQKDKKENELVIIEQDDGIGFDYNRQKKSPGKGFGLSMIRDRIVLFGGTLQAEQMPAGGMQFIITIPVKRRG